MDWRLISSKRVALLATLTAVAVLSLFVTACGGDDDDGGGAGGGGATSIDVVMRDNSFAPNAITVPAGKEITFNLDNKGQAIHNMRTAGPDGRYETGDDIVSKPDTVRGGQKATLKGTFQPGSIDFRCDFHPDEMTGKITAQ